MRKILFLTVLFMIFGCGCNKQTSVEEEQTETDVTTVGGYDFVVIIDGNAEIVESGTPYTDEEIMTALENKMEHLQDEFGSGSYLSRNGYYQISYNEEKAQMELDYYHYYIPVVKDRQMIGELDIWPYSDGTLAVSSCKYWGDHWGFRLGELLEEKKELAMFHWPLSEYVVSRDNEVFTLHGNENPDLLNVDRLYSTLNHGDNLLTEKIFNEDEYYYRFE